MKTKLLSENEGGEKTFALIYERGDECVAELRTFAHEWGLVAARVQGIGGFSDVTLAYFDRSTMQYQHIPLNDQVEVLSLLGDIALEDGLPKPHLHAVVGMRDGTTRGGHVMQAHVWPTLELLVIASPAPMYRQHDRETGLTLIVP
jgi:predicted DNA-binding protein with PD1-like motif